MRSSVHGDPWLLRNLCWRPYRTHRKGLENIQKQRCPFFCFSVFSCWIEVFLSTFRDRSSNCIFWLAGMAIKLCQLSSIKPSKPTDLDTERMLKNKEHSQRRPENLMTRTALLKNNTREKRPPHPTLFPSKLQPKSNCQPKCSKPRKPRSQPPSKNKAKQTQYLSICYLSDLSVKITNNPSRRPKARAKAKQKHSGQAWSFPSEQEDP